VTVSKEPETGRVDGAARFRIAAGFARLQLGPGGMTMCRHNGAAPHPQPSDTFTTAVRAMPQPGLGADQRVQWRRPQP